MRIGARPTPDPHQVEDLHRWFAPYTDNRMCADHRRLLEAAAVAACVHQLEDSPHGQWADPCPAGLGPWLWDRIADDRHRIEWMRPVDAPCSHDQWRHFAGVLTSAWRTWSGRIRRLITCHTRAVEYTACNGDVRYRPYKCGSLFCQRCMKLERRRHLRMVRACRKRCRYQPRMLTLTIPSWSRCRGMRRSIQVAFTRLRAMRGGLWQYVRAAIGAYEHEESAAGAHTHLHLMIDASGFIPWNRVVAEWQVACGCKCQRDDDGPPQLCKWIDKDLPGGDETPDGTWRINPDETQPHKRFRWAEIHPDCPGRYGGMPAPTAQDIRAVKDVPGGIERELAKYVSKGLTNIAKITDPETLADLFAEFWGRQRMVRFGAWSVQSRDPREAHDISEETKLEKELPIHDVCGTACWEFTGIVETASLDWDKMMEQQQKQERGP